MPLLLLSISLRAQTGIQAPVKFKVEDGDFTESSVVIRNTTTGESNSLPGASRLDILLKPNCDYILSFQKPGYITKRIAFSTSAPADRAAQGFYPFPFEVNLFKQYDGINIVVFNQPVGKIEYNRLIDDFDYDTDYTKQIHSALKEAEEALKARQAEDRKFAEQQKKEEEKRKEEEAKLAKAEQKANLEAKKKADAEARQQALVDAQLKKKEEEEKRRQALATAAEEKRQMAIARLEAEERAKLKAREEEEERARAAQSGGDDTNTAAVPGSGDVDNRNSVSMGSGSDPNEISVVSSTSGSDRGTAKAGSVSGEDIKPVIESIPKAKSDSNLTNVSQKQEVGQRSEAPTTYEVMPDQYVESIRESNRSITRVTVRYGNGSIVFSKIEYDWGGVYYFKNRMSITENHFVWATRAK